MWLHCVWCVCCWVWVGGSRPQMEGCGSPPLPTLFLHTPHTTSFDRCSSSFVLLCKWIIAVKCSNIKKCVKRLLITKYCTQKQCVWESVVNANEFRLLVWQGHQEALLLFLVCVCPFNSHYTHLYSCLRTGCNTMMSSLVWLAVRLLMEGGEMGWEGVGEGPRDGSERKCRHLNGCGGFWIAVCACVCVWL